MGYDVIEDVLRENATRTVIDLVVHRNKNVKRTEDKPGCVDCQANNLAKFSFCRIGSIFVHVQRTEFTDLELLIDRLQRLHPQFFEEAIKLWDAIKKDSEQRMTRVMEKG